MKVVYVDVLFAVNFVLNYLLLSATARAGGVYLTLWRTAAGAAAGGAAAVVLFFLPLNFPLQLLSKAACCWLMTAAAFAKREKQPLGRLCLILCCMSFAFAGAIFAISYLGKPLGLLTMRNGVPYFQISFLFLVATSAASYLLLTLLFGGGGFRAKQETKEVEAELNGRRLRFRVLVDSGNLLHDPISGKPVMLIGVREGQALLPPEAGAVLQQLPEQGAEACFSRLAGLEGGFRLIPYHTAQSNHGFIIAVKPTNITIDGRAGAQYLLGFAPADFQMSNGCRGIVGV